MRRLGLAGVVFLAAAHKSEALAIGRPARLRVMLAVGHADGRVIAGSRDHPDRGFVAGTLFVDVNAGESDTRSVGRKLRIGNPDKGEDVLIGYRALGRRSRGLGGE